MISRSGSTCSDERGKVCLGIDRILNYDGDVLKRRSEVNGLLIALVLLSISINIRIGMIITTTQSITHPLTIPLRL